jgi:hypothetical protein
MNTSTQPPEGAGGSRSKAAGELTLGLLSGERRCGVCRSAFDSVGAKLARDGGLTAGLSFLDVHAKLNAKKTTCSGGFSAFRDQS